MKKKLKIGIMYGGDSCEHEVSCMAADSILKKIIAEIDGIFFGGILGALWTIMPKQLLINKMEQNVNTKSNKK